MKTKKNKFSLLLGAGIILLAMACTDTIMDKINVDKNHPMDAQSKFIMTDLITSTAFTTVGGDFSLYAAIYVEHETGVHNQMYNAEVRQGEPISSTTYNNVWNSTYANIKKAKIIIDKCSAGGDEKGNEVTLGAAKVLLAYNAAVMADLFGDTPFSQAGEINPDGTPEYMQPAIDKQNAIYASVMRLLDEAIVHLDGTDAGYSGAMGRSDLMYNGNKALWKKAAYGLKARYTMRLLNRSADQAADLNNILSYLNQSFTAAGEEMKFTIYDGDANVNPLFAFSNSRDALGASKSLRDKFVELNDPRGNQYFMDYDFIQITDPAQVVVAPNGSPEQSQYVYNLSMACYAYTAPSIMLSYHELLFLKAEALCRLNRAAEAGPVLRDAVKAAFANLQTTLESTIDFISSHNGRATVDLGAAVAENYFTNSVQPLFAVNPLKETMVQKYLAFAGASGEAVEAYNDYRRLEAMGEHFVVLDNPLNNSSFPLRFAYGSSDVLANVAMKNAYGDGQYVYTEKVWWAGGDR